MSLPAVHLSVATVMSFAGGADGGGAGGGEGGGGEGGGGDGGGDGGGGAGDPIPVCRQPVVYSVPSGLAAEWPLPHSHRRAPHPQPSCHVPLVPSCGFTSCGLM